MYGYKNTVYVADYNNKVLKWWPGLAAPQIIVGNANGTQGTPPTVVWAPMHAFVDANNEIYVGEFVGKRTSKYNRTNGQLQLRANINVFVTSGVIHRVDQPVYHRWPSYQNDSCCRADVYRGCT